MLYFSASLLLLGSEFEKQIKSKLFESGIQLKGKCFPGMYEVPDSIISTAKAKSTLPKNKSKRKQKSLICFETHSLYVSLCAMELAGYL